MSGNNTLQQSQKIHHQSYPTWQGEETKKTKEEQSKWEKLFEENYPLQSKPSKKIVQKTLLYKADSVIGEKPKKLQTSSKSIKKTSSSSSSSDDDSSSSATQSSSSSSDDDSSSSGSQSSSTNSDDDSSSSATQTSSSDSDNDSSSSGTESSSESSSSQTINYTLVKKSSSQKEEVFVVETPQSEISETASVVKEEEDDMWITVAKVAGTIAIAVLAGLCIYSIVSKQPSSTSSVIPSSTTSKTLIDVSSKTIYNNRDPLGGMGRHEKDLRHALHILRDDPRMQDVGFRALYERVLKFIRGGETTKVDRVMKALYKLIMDESNTKKDIAKAIEKILIRVRQGNFSF